MKSRTLTRITAVIVFVALAIPFQSTAQNTRYTVTDLGTLGGTFSVALGMNNRGDVEASQRCQETRLCALFFGAMV
jgi:hypothetical protein